MGNLFKDLRFSFRALTRKPGAALLSVVAFGLGIGLTTTMFSITYGVYFRGIGVPDQDRLVVIRRTRLDQDETNLTTSQHDLYDWRAQQESFEGMAGYRTGTVNINGTEGPERFAGGFVSANLFRILRVQPVLGRTFSDRDDLPGAPYVVLLGHSVWENRYDSDPGVLGKSLRVNGEPGTIIGVMPAGFQFPLVQELWVPDRDARAEMQNRHEGFWVQVIARLNTGVPVDQAGLELATIAQRLALEYPDANEGIGIRFSNFVEDAIGDEANPMFAAMMVATIFVLLIACANVANLLLARAALRTKEAALRTAIGAGRLRVIFPFFAEALLLSVVGGVLGVLIAFGGVAAFNNSVTDVGKPYWMDITVDLPILAYVLAVVALTCLASGAARAIQILRTNVNAVLKDESRGSSSFTMGRLSRFLVIGEVALSCALLVGAGLMTKSIVNLSSRDYVFSTDDVFTARIGLFEIEYPDAEVRREFYRQLQERLDAIPSAQVASITSALPAAGANGGTITIEGEAYESERDYPSARWAINSPGVFQTFGVDLLRGRDFTIQDDAESQEVIIVNQRFLQRFFPNEDPIGQRIRQGGADSEAPWLTIIGVVPDLEMSGLDPEDDPAGFYVPIAQSDSRFMSLAIQTRGGDPLAITQEVRDAVFAVNADLPMYWIRGMDAVIRESTWFYSVFGSLFVVFGIAALFLASVGLYGVLSFSVTRRIQEMGIRMALGAAGRDVLTLIMRQGMTQLAIGLVVGLALAMGVSNTVGLIMVEVEPRDPFVFVTVTLVIMLVGVVASLVPATRAVRVDPMVALRYE